ncbi:hypothetical protein IC582_015934 [Cucumis melo]
MRRLKFNRHRSKNHPCHVVQSYSSVFPIYNPRITQSLPLLLDRVPLALNA